MELDKVDLCEVRAAFDGEWLHQLPGDWEWFLERVRRDKGSEGTLSGHAYCRVIAARERNRPKCVLSLDGQ